MEANLGKNVELQMIQAPLAAGSSDPTSSVVDMQGFNGCLFVGNLGTVNSTGSVTLKVGESSSSGGTFNDLSGATVSSSAGEDDGILAIDIVRPNDRFLQATLTRAGASAEWGGTVAVKYGGVRKPISSTLAATLVTSVSPST